MGCLLKTFYGVESNIILSTYSFLIQTCKRNRLSQGRLQNYKPGGGGEVDTVHTIFLQVVRKCMLHTGMGKILKNQYRDTRYLHFATPSLTCFRRFSNPIYVKLPLDELPLSTTFRESDCRLVKIIIKK